MNSNKTLKLNLRSIIIAALLCIPLSGFSQDIISFKKGTKVEATVTEITPSVVKYRLFSEPSGKEYFAYKDAITSIVYKDGRVETFNGAPAPEVSKARVEAETRRENAEQVRKERAEQRKAEAELREKDAEQRRADAEKRKAELTERRIEAETGDYQDVFRLKNGSVIRGKIIEQTPNKTYKVETSDGSVFSIQSTEITRITKEYRRSGSHRQNYARSGKKTTFKTTSDGGLLPGYKFLVEAGPAFGIGKYGLDRIDIHVINGYQINPHFSAGLGIGLDYYYNQKDDRRRDYGDDVVAPLFADLRYNILNAKISPYIAAQIGYSFDATDNLKALGMYASPSLGVTFMIGKYGVHAGLGYETQQQSHLNYWTGALSIRAGFSF